MEFPCVDRVRRVCREGKVVQSLRQEAARLFQELWFLSSMPLEQRVLRGEQ